MSRESRRRRQEEALLATQHRSARHRSVKLAAILLVLVVASFFAWWNWDRHVDATSEAPASQGRSGRPPRSYLELCALGTNEVEQCDIALMNLLCAEGLRGAESLDVDACLKLLDGIAQGVKFETDRHLYKFFAKPEEYNHSEGYYRMMMMAAVLQQDLGIHYSPERLRMPWEPLEESHKFFENAADVFIHGLTRKGGTGTCSSMPVFYVAVGRRLGYPLTLVKARDHLFARWNEREKSFNIEGTSVGFVSNPDEFYRTFPASFTAEEAEAESYLKSLTPAQELAVFLTIRGHCLRAVGDFKRALGAFAQAFYKDPGSIGCQLLYARAEREAAAAGVLPRINTLALEVGSLELPAGPMQPIFAERKARLMSRIHAGASAADIEPEFMALKVEMMQRHPPIPWRAPGQAVPIEPPQHPPLQPSGPGIQPQRR